MADEKIKVKSESGQLLEVMVTDKKPDAIWVAIGEGIHNVKCKLLPTRNGLAYAGSVMGREIIYERSVQQVRDDLAHAAHVAFQHQPRKR